MILCSRLDLPGGIEKAIIQLANLLDKKRYQVTLVILDETDDNFYPLTPTINVLQEPLFFGITDKGNTLTRKTAFVRDILHLGRKLRSLKADVVIATEYAFAIASVLTGIRKSAKLITWEHHHLHELSKSFFWKQMFRVTYPRTDVVVCLNPDEKKLYDEFNDNTVVIPNFITRAGAAAELTNQKILTVGRLTHVKGTDFLVQAARLVLEKHPGWQWLIIGEGDMQGQLLASIKNENLEHRLLLLAPLSPELHTQYADSSIYACTSRHESFGMTILEAMSVGLPCVSFDCETGPRHVITHNEDGLLVEKENPEKLAEAISTLIIDEAKRKRMGARAYENVKRFSSENIYPLWEKLLAGKSPEI